jgi:hypothetical protein
LKFKTTHGVVKAKLNVQRKTIGRYGVVNSYIPVEAGFSAVETPLKDPILKPIDGALPDSAPIQVKVSGFSAVEYERSSNFGYDIGTTTTAAATNFDAAATGNKQSNFNFLSDIQFDISKDRTTLTTLIEFGEIYFGDSNSGGAQGARSRIVELRNLFLTHSLSDWINFKGGIFNIQSDPRSFILNDSYGAFQANYTTDIISGSVWYANATSTAPGTTYASANNDYAGFSGSLALLSGFKHTLYGVYRKTRESFYNTALTELLTGNSEYYWLGGTVEYGIIHPLTTEVTVIGNWSKFAPDTGTSDNISF